MPFLLAHTESNAGPPPKPPNKFVPLPKVRPKKDKKMGKK